MPSGKLKAAVAGRTYVPTYGTAPAATTRFGVVPTDPELARVQEDLRAAGGGSGGALGESPFKTGQILTVNFHPIASGGGGLEQTIPHQLGGTIRGFVVCDKVCDTAVDIVRDDDTTTTPINAARSATHIKLRASSACVAKIWVWR